MSEDNTSPVSNDIGVKIQLGDIKEGSKGYRRSLILTVDSSRISDLQIIGENVINDIDPKLCEPATDLRPEDQED